MNADPTTCQAVILDEADDGDRRLLDDLRADPCVEFLDRRDEQLAGLRRLIPGPTSELVEEPLRWAYYPWRRAVVGVLGPLGFRTLRLDRNRNLITADEQRRLGGLRIGVAGLSVGHVIAHTLVAEGLCGEIRLADFDTLELSNLNRIPATILDLGENKAVLAARRIAELDPYLRVRVFTAGLTTDTLDEFLAGLDVVVEECDSLDMKAIVREEARARRLPVLMATSDRGLIDIERFDLEPGRPILHGLIGDTDAASLAGMDARDKIPHMLRHLDVPRASPKAAASMVEVGVTLTTWPQLAGDVILGATAVAEAVRRIGLGERLQSGRIRIDVADGLDHLQDPAAAAVGAVLPAATGEPSETTELGDTVIDAMAAAAIRAPSGGNAQPWYVEKNPDSILIRLAHEYSSPVDVNIGLRSSATAIGAAAFNAQVAAAAQHACGSVEFNEQGNDLEAIVTLGDRRDDELAAFYRPMLARETNRRVGTPGAISAQTRRELEAAASTRNASLRFIDDRAVIDELASIMTAADRVRYLTPRLHAEMVAELRWPDSPDSDSGLDVNSLELNAGELAALELLRRGDVMAYLAAWDAGTTLGADTRDRVRASSALGIVTAPGEKLTDYARGGAAAEAVWILAQQRGLAVQPISPMFVHAREDSDLRTLSDKFASTLGDLQRQFADVCGLRPDDVPVIVLRFTQAPAASVRSRRSEGRIRSRLVRS
ncbi:MAG TPA: Rv1355c family protein [Mycobacterium sp.]